MSGTNHTLPISVICIADHYSPPLQKALDSVTWAAEIIILDPSGELKLPPRARFHPQPRVVKITAIKDFSQVRNAGAELAKYDWVLQLDSDEWLEFTPETFDTLRYELQQAAAWGVAALEFHRIDIFFGRAITHGEILNQYHARLYDRRQAKFGGVIHERLWSKAPIIRSSLTLFHRPHRQLQTFITKVNVYAWLLAKEKFADSDGDAPTGWWCLRLTLWPIGKALSSFFLWRGWRDDWRGLVYIVMMSFHSWLVRVYWYERTQKKT